MSVLINMELPKNCYDCPLAMQDYTTLFGKKLSRTRNSYACVLTHKSITSTKRNRFCPLIEIPPHGRLIDADAFERHECNECDGACEALLCDCTNCDAECRCDFMLDIHSAPTIIPAEPCKEKGE